MFRNLSAFFKYHKQPTSWRRDLLWQLFFFSQIIKKFSNFYGTRKIITVFIRSLYCTLKSSLMSSSSLWLGHANDLYLSGSPPKILCAFLLSLINLFLIIHHPSYSWFDDWGNIWCYLVKSTVATPTSLSFYIYIYTFFFFILLLFLSYVKILLQHFILKHFQSI